MPRKGDKKPVRRKPAEIENGANVSPAFIMPGLTPAQREARGRGLGGSDAERIMKGDWLRLWGEKTGRTPPEDLSGNLAVQMGNVTEAFNAFWFEKQRGIHVNRAPSVVDKTHVHPKREYMVCNIDGLVYIDGRMRLFDAKHTNPFGSKAEAPARYLAQMQHSMEVLDLEGCELSVLFGNSDWQSFSLERDRDYCALLMEREAEFWEFIRKDTPPPGDAEEVQQKVAPELMRSLNMRSSNSFREHEADWIRLKIFADQFDEAAKSLKEAVPADCDFAFGEELVVVRNRGGSLAIRHPNKKDTLRIEDQLQQEEATDEAADKASNVDL